MITGFEHSVQLSVFIKSIGSGFILGLFFILFVILNLFYSKSIAAVCIRDIVFILSSAVFTFLFALKYNSGIVRFYIIAGEIIGFSLCYMSVPDIVRVVLSRIKNFIYIIKIKKNKKNT